MNYIVRPAKLDDIERIYDISKQFTLLNLPADKEVILKKIEKSKLSFSGKLDIKQSNYFFVCEDLSEKKVVGCCQIIGQKGSPENPAYSFKISKKEMFSPELSMGFIHQVIQLRVEEDGPSEIGGLILDKNYRSKTKNLGKLISYSRFAYMAKAPERFRDTILSDMAPPLLENGKSEIWEALGRRFTGMTYAEADELSQLNKNFIKSLFPQEEIYLCLLDAKARINIGQVGRQTKPALHMLKSIGFEYINEIDPFDGGPHLRCNKIENNLISKKLSLRVQCKETPEEAVMCLVLAGDKESFGCSLVMCTLDEQCIYLNQKSLKTLSVTEKEQVLVIPI